MSLIRSMLARFCRAESGSVAVETMLMTPIIVWFFVAPLQYFEAYRAELMSNRAALTIADMYSRETGYINPNYLNGTQKLLRELTIVDDRPDFRVTLFFWNETQKKYKVRWSRRRGSQGVLRTVDLATMKHRLPILSHQERAILFETWTDYTPKFGNGFGVMESTGLKSQEFRTFVVISPRFAPTVCWNAFPDDPSKERC